MPAETGNRAKTKVNDMHTPQTQNPNQAGAAEPDYGNQQPRMVPSVGIKR
jgi:hypothetical protein